MKSGEVPGPNDIPVEVWRCVGEGGGLFKQVVLLHLGQWENALGMRMCTGANFQGEEETADEVPKRVVFVLSSDGSYFIL